MPDQDKQNPTTGSESDISKSQSQQQPPNQASQQSETGERQGQFETGQQGQSELTGDQAATGQAQGSSPDAGLQGDTLTQQRTDIEGGSLQPSETSEEEGGFVGSEGRQDTSSKLVEDQDFEKGGQGAPEGK
jgi:hypothetical protein